MGVGTGRLGEYLFKAGSTQIYGIEPCEALIKLAEKKEVYKEIKIRYCGTGDLETEWKEKFDAAVGSGCFCKNHIPP